MDGGRVEEKFGLQFRDVFERVARLGPPAVESVGRFDWG